MKLNHTKSFFSLLILFSVLLTACGPVTPIPPLPSLTPKPVFTSTRLPIPTLPILTFTPSPSPMPILDTDCTDEGVVKPTLETFYENGKLARIGRGELYGVDWSSDGSKIAIASETGVYIIDAIQMKKVNYINTGHAVEVVRFSPDGKLVATDDENQVAVWDIDTGEVVARIGSDFDYYSWRAITPSTSEMGNISFSPDGRLIAIHTLKFPGVWAIEIWDVETQKLVREWMIGDHPDPVFSPDGKLIASPWTDVVNVWNVETGEVVNQIKDTRSFAFFSGDGHKIVTESRGKGPVILIVDLQTNATVRVELYNPNDNIMPVVGRLSSDGKILATHHNEHKKSYIDTWDASTGKHLLSLSLPDFVTEIAFNPIRNELVAIDRNQNVRIWNLENGALLRTYQFSEFIGGKIYPSPDGSILIIKTGEHFDLYNAANGGYVCALQGTIERNFYASFNPHGDEFAYITPEGKAIVWNWRNGNVVQAFMPEQLGDQSPLGDDPLVYRKISFGNQEKGFVAWGWENGESKNITWIGTSCGAFGAPTSCPGAISSDGRYIATLDQLEGITIRDASSLEILYQISEARGSSNFAFSPDGKYLLSLGFGYWRIDVWATTTQEHVAEFNAELKGEGPILWTQEFSFTATGDKLVTHLPYFYKYPVRVWNTKTWEVENAFYTIGGPGDAKISGDGSLVSALSTSGYAIYLWHLDK